jgi:hypothetical protein
VKVLLDEHVPMAVADALRARGHDAVAVAGDLTSARWQPARSLPAGRTPAWCSAARAARRQSGLAWEASPMRWWRSSWPKAKTGLVNSVVWLPASV